MSDPSALPTPSGREFFSSSRRQCGCTWLGCSWRTRYLSWISIVAGWKPSSSEASDLSIKVSDGLFSSNLCRSDNSFSNMDDNPWTHRPPIAVLRWNWMHWKAECRRIRESSLD